MKKDVKTVLDGLVEQPEFHRHCTIGYQRQSDISVWSDVVAHCF